jgi:anti-sigma B factor antagonist
MELTADVRAGGVAVIRLVGRLDLLSAAEVRQRLAQAVADGNRRLVVDLGDVAFVDSSGLAALIGGLKAARLAGGDLRLARAGDQARLILKVTQLDQILRPYPTLEEALAGY